MSERIPTKRAAQLLEQARLHLARNEFARAREVAEEVLARSELKAPLPYALLGEALLALGDSSAAAQKYREGLQAFPKDPDLTARLAVALSRGGQHAEARALFQRVHKAREREPVFLTQYAYTLSQLGELEEAERLAIRAVSAGGGPESKLTLAIVRGKQGRYPDAQKLLLEVERTARSEAVVVAAKAARADAQLLQGDAQGALALWKTLRAAQRLSPQQLAHAAYAAELCGEHSLCDELIAQRAAADPVAEDWLLFAQISNLRNDPEQTLRHLEASQQAPGPRHPAHAFEVEATRGRAHRLAGRPAQARQVLAPLAGMPEAAQARLGPQVWVDLGHLAADAGDFDAAAEQFRGALALDPEEPEALNGLSLAQRHLSASVERPGAAQAEAEAMRRRFSAREGELDALRRELERLSEAKRQAERKAREAEERARKATEEARAVAAGSGRKVREELEQREAEIEEKMLSNLDRALAEAGPRCPPAILDALKVAERTFQKSLYTELPAAAVAVLYTGALERALYTLFVDRFRIWLDEAGHREAFLKAATRERRGTRVEYFDYFVEAFDLERPGRAPSLGEVGRVLERRHESYLAAFREFLSGAYPATDAVYDALARFVAWSKESIRDPVAHGRMDAVGYEELRSFREQFLFDLGGMKKGALRALLGP